MKKKLEVYYDQNKVRILDRETNQFAEANNFDTAVTKLKEKNEQLKKLGEKFGLKLINLSLQKNTLIKKWVLAFIFVTLISISFSYSIAVGIKNGVESINFPKGSKLWSQIGDEIIKAADSETINDFSREEEINNSLLKIKRKIRPYLNFFSTQNCDE